MCITNQVLTLIVDTSRLWRWIVTPKPRDFESES
jgi:hypothetical protein